MPVSASSHTIAIHQVVQITQGARQRGLPVDRLLLRAGIAPALLGSPLSRVTQAQYAALIRTLRRHARDELWSLCSQPLPLGSFDQACRLLIHCRTLGEALHAGLHFFRLMLHDFVPRMQVANERACIRLESRAQRDASLAYAERSFCFFTYGVMSWLVARRIPLVCVHYPDDVSPFGTEAERLFQAPVRCDVRHMGLEFEARWLDLPIVQTSQSLDEFLKQAPTSLLVKYRDQTTLTERIRRLLRRNLSGELPSLEEISQSLTMTPQTLRRRLQAEGQGYQKIKDDLRRDVAIDYLSQPELTLLDIANRLGFSEASTFHRAFKAWTGQSPGIYRQTHLSAAQS